LPRHGDTPWKVALPGTLPASLSAVALGKGHASLRRGNKAVEMAN